MAARQEMSGKGRLWVPLALVALLLGSAFGFAWWAEHTDRGLYDTVAANGAPYPDWYLEAGLPVLNGMLIQSDTAGEAAHTLEMTSSRPIDDINLTFEQELTADGWTTVSRPAPNAFVLITTYTRASRTVRLDLADAGGMRIIKLSLL
jgi:hypothetical protein